MSRLLKGTILLVSPHTSHRSGLRKTLSDLGADNRLIEVAANYTQAKERLAKEPVNIIITDDEFENRQMGIDLIELHAKNNPVSRDRVFVLMVNDSSPFLLADFSLRGGDIILSKPFKNETFINTLNDALTSREKAGVEVGLSYDLQDALKENDLEKANKIYLNFKDRQNFHALFSEASIQEANKELVEAYETYSRAVLKKVDFKALVRLVKIGTQSKKHFEMLQFVELWLKTYPIHHDSLSDMARIIIANEKFELLDEIFELFVKNKINDTFAKIPLAAAFVMAATRHLENGELDKAKIYAHKGIEYSCKKMPILIKAMQILLKAGAPDEAEQAYLRVSNEVVTTEDKVFDLIMRGIIYPKDKVLAECTKLLAQKIIHPDIYLVAIDCMKSLGKNPDDLILEARKAFPDKKF